MLNVNNHQWFPTGELVAAFAAIVLLSFFFLCLFFAFFSQASVCLQVCCIIQAGAYFIYLG